MPNKGVFIPGLTDSKLNAQESINKIMETIPYGPNLRG